MAFGTAYVFLLPFEIHTAESLRQPRDATVSGRRVTVYPPFRNGDGLQLRRALDNKSLPHWPGTASPASRLPIADAKGRPGWPVPFVLADALRIDVQGLGEGEDSIANAIGARLLRFVRLMTRQWWILRGASESLAPLQNTFPVDGWGQPVGGTLSHTVYVIPWLKSEILVDSNALGIACAYMAANVDVPPSCSTLLDAVFAMAHDDKDQAVLLAAIACEALVAEQAAELVERGELPRRVARREVNVSDLRKRVDTGAQRMFGRSFAADCASGADGLGRLWVARHALAHGSRRQHERNAVLNDQLAFANAIAGAFRLFEWFARLRPRDVPDPLALMLRPLTPAA